MLSSPNLFARKTPLVSRGMAGNWQDSHNHGARTNTTVHTSRKPSYLKPDLPGRKAAKWRAKRGRLDDTQSTSPRQNHEQTAAALFSLHVVPVSPGRSYGWNGIVNAAKQTPVGHFHSSRLQAAATCVRTYSRYNRPPSCT